MAREKRTPSRTDLEKDTPEEIIKKHGILHYLQALLKSQKPHDSSRKLRRMQRTSKIQERSDDD